MRKARNRLPRVNAPNVGGQPQNPSKVEQGVRSVALRRLHSAQRRVGDVYFREIRESLGRRHDAPRRMPELGQPVFNADGNAGGVRQRLRRLNNAEVRGREYVLHSG